MASSCSEGRGDSLCRVAERVRGGRAGRRQGTWRSATPATRRWCPAARSMGVVKWFSWGRPDLGAAGHEGGDGVGCRGEPFRAAWSWPPRRSKSSRGFWFRRGHLARASPLGVPGHTQHPSSRHGDRARPLRVHLGGRLLPRRRYARGRGRHLAPLLTGHEHAAGVQGEHRGLVEGFGVSPRGSGARGCCWGTTG
jgi:hypothetical protein